ncbi:MAG: glycosyltransferase [Patescibacteria group bacterium]
MSQKIKIIFVMNAMEIGGAEKFFYDLLKHLDKEKFAPQLATVIGSGALENDFRALGLPVHIFGHRRLSYLGGIRQCWQLYRLFKKEKPQIVHTQLFAADLWGRLAARLARVPIIITTEQNINYDQSWIRELLKRITYHLADATVAISSAVKRYARYKYKVPKDKILMIPNDVDVDEFEKQLALSSVVKPAKPVILTVGRLVEQKGQKYLLEAFAELKNKEKYELWVVGEGPLRAVLEQQTKELGIGEQVKFLGARRDIPALLSQADLFVFPSLWEGLGIAVLEAALAKAPIVASAVDGILDIIEDNETGYLVESGDSEDLQFTMEKMLANPGRAKFMAEAAYAKVKNNFDIKVVVRKYEELYQHVIARSEHSEQRSNLVDI